MSIKDMVSGNRQAHFLRYRNGELWYSTECGFEFPVPVAELGNATVMAQERAILLMRYIRKHLELLEQAQAVSAARMAC